MWKETTATEPPKTTMPAGPAKPVTEDELRSILDRLESTGTFSARIGNCGVFCPAAKARPRHCGRATPSWKKSCGNSPRRC